MTMLTPWNLPHGQWSKKLTMNDHDILDFVHGQWSILTNFDHLTTVILKFWSCSKIFDHNTLLTPPPPPVTSYSPPPPPPLISRLVSSNHSHPRPMAWRRNILPDPAKKKISGQYSILTILLLRCHLSYGILGLQLHKDIILLSERKIHVAKYTHKLFLVEPKFLNDIIITKLTSYIAGSSEYSRRRGHGR